MGCEGHNMSNNCWLPDLVLFNDYSNNWNNYQEVIYNIFKEDIVDNPLSFDGKIIKIRWQPIEYGKPEAFFHVTCQDYNKDGKRLPDFRRCERIRWIRAFIKNYKCDSSLCESCAGVKVWNEICQNKMRVHILLEEERYIVVVEPRENYCLLITAFYFEHNHALKKKLKRYEKFKEQ